MVAKKTTTSNDVEALTPDPELVTLESGLQVRIEPLKTRGMFKLMKIVTRGAGPLIFQMPLDFNNTEAFPQQLLTVLTMAIPEAESEAIEFIQAMVTPADFKEVTHSKADDQANKELFERLAVELDDPTIDDTFTIISAIITNEAPHIQALGKRLGSILQTQIPALKN